MAETASESRAAAAPGTPAAIARFGAALVRDRDAQRRLRQARERFLDGTAPVHDSAVQPGRGSVSERSPVRTEIAGSWRRSRGAALLPDHFDPPHDDAELRGSNLLEAAGPVIEGLATQLTGTNTSIILTDRQGWIIGRWADTPSLAATLDRNRSCVGFSLREDAVGTNGLGSVIETRRPFQVCDAEHFASQFLGLTCAGAPIRHPINGRLEGVIDITCRFEDTNALLLPLAMRAASDIEGLLYGRASARERALLQLFLAAGRGRGRPVLSLSDEMVIASTSATRILGDVDVVALWEGAAAASRGQGTSFDVATRDGTTFRADCRPAYEADELVGAIVHLGRALHPPPVPATRTPAPPPSPPIPSPTTASPAHPRPADGGRGPTGPGPVADTSRGYGPTVDGPSRQRTGEDRPPTQGTSAHGPDGLGPHRRSPTADGQAGQRPDGHGPVVEALGAFARPSTNGDTGAGTAALPGGLAGSSPAWRRVVELAETAAASTVPTLLDGEPGSGKRALARVIHDLSGAEGPLRIHCCALSLVQEPSTWFDRLRTQLDDPAGSILLCHLDALEPAAADAATAVIDDHPGPLPRLLSTRRCASNPGGADRSALANTIGAIRIVVPPLRDRSADIGPIVRALTIRHGHRGRRWRSDALQVLARHRWPDNIRQLEQVVGETLLIHRRPDIAAADLPADLQAGTKAPFLGALEQAELEVLLNALDRAGGNKTEAAKAIGMARSTLYRKLRDYGIDLDRRWS